jgi:MYXO-CTERM domain-containing protein
MVYRRLFIRLAAAALAASCSSTLLAAGCVAPQSPAPDEPVASVGERLEPTLEWKEQQKIQPNDTLPYTYFGCAIAIDGDRAIFGGYRADNDRGAGYVFSWDLERKKWIQEARLTVEDSKANKTGQVGDNMGSAVAILGDTAVVAAPSQGRYAGDFLAGTAYVFQKSGTTWQYVTNLKAPAPDHGNCNGFGAALAISKDYIFVGTNSGQWASSCKQYNAPITHLESVYAFDRRSLTSPPKVIRADDKNADRLFGASLAVDGDTLVVGARSDSTKVASAGAVYVFQRQGEAWVQSTKLTATDVTVGAALGFSVAISGDTIATGAPGDVNRVVHAGSVYVFTNGPDGWSNGEKLLADDSPLLPVAYNRVGGSVALSKDTLVVGRVFSYATSTMGGFEQWQYTDNAAYRFERVDGIWSGSVRFKGHDTPTPPADKSATTGRIFGNAVAVSDRWLIVGDPESDTFADDDSGAAYIFTTRGQACMNDAACSTGYCVDGVCCESACDGTCEACSAAKKGGGVDGACGPVKDHTDPESDCLGYVCVTASQEGADAGAGADASGDVDAGASCIGESCSKGICLTTCSSSADCINGYCDLKASPPACKKVPPIIEFDQGCGCRTAPGSSDAPPGTLAAVSLFGAFGLVVRRVRRHGRTRSLPPLRAGARGRMSARLAWSALALGLGVLGCGVNEGDPGSWEAVGFATSAVSPDEIKFEQHAQIVAERSLPDNQFGRAVAVSGDTVVVGSPQKPGVPVAGAAYVYARDGEGRWSETVLPAGSSPDPSFGEAVAISGDVIAVGAPRQPAQGAIDAGAVYIFKRVDKTWMAVQTIRAVDAAKVGDQFGAALALQGDTLAIGMPAPGMAGTDTKSGQVYIFQRGAADMWTLQTSLAMGASVAAVDDRFGSALAISGDRLAVGAPNADVPLSNTGAVHMFHRTHGSWMYERKLSLREAAKENDRIGSVVAMDGARVVAAVVPTASAPGAAYVFALESDDIALLEPTGGAVNEGFGSSLAIAGDTVLVGAPSGDGIGPRAGVVYVFMSRSGAWLSSRITVQNGRMNDRFGAAVVLSERSALLGAPAHLVQRLNKGDSSGAVYDVLLGTLRHCSDDTHSVAGLEPGQDNAPVSQDCGAYLCEKATGECPKTCLATSECRVEHFCDSGVCTPNPPQVVGPNGCVASVARGGDVPASASWCAWGMLGLVALLRARGHRGARR